MKQIDIKSNTCLMERNRVWPEATGMFTVKDKSQAKAEARSKRASVTRVLYAKGRFMAKYRSPLIKARWMSEESHNQLVIVAVIVCNGHNQEEASSRSKI